MEQFVDLLKEVNIAQIFILLVGLWVFYNRLDKKILDLKQDIEKNKADLKQDIEKNKAELKQDIEKNKAELKQDIEKNKTDLKQDIEKLKQDVQKLGDKVDDLDRRLCRIEGSLATQGHCLFNQARPEQKAE